MDVEIKHPPAEQARRTQPRNAACAGGCLPAPLARAWAALLLLIWVGAVAPDAAAQGSREYDVKGVLLFNFTQFVDWPEDSFPAVETPVVIGVLGRDPFGPILDDIVLHEKCGSRSIKIERYRNVEAVRNCQILFVSDSEQADLPRIFRVLHGRPILTVGDFEGFALRGGMIRFMKNPAGKINLRINLNAIKSAGLTVSAKLLRAAEVVTSSD